MVIIPTPVPVEMAPSYHAKKSDRTVDSQLDLKEFIAWDGEGVNLRGEGKPQSYVLFGNSEDYIANPRGLDTFQCLDFIIDIGIRYPKRTHVGFAFTYDSNMIVQSLSPVTLAKLHQQGWVRIANSDGEKYVITFLRGKYFRVTKQFIGYNRKTNPNAKITVCIYDIFSFFNCSFIRAYEDMIGPIPDVIERGKAERGNFHIDAFDEILYYWSVEIQLLKKLVEELRKRVYNAGLRINEWYGPGALASYALKQHQTKKHLVETNEEIRKAARYAYAGGRFELFKVGRFSGPIYGIDRNSAYPFAISQLPSLIDGEWEHVIQPTRLAKFGVYRVALKKFAGFTLIPGPVFHRDKEHNITFPWITDGWYWGPEAFHAQQLGATIVEGWEFHGYSLKPFTWIADMYDQRREWKLRGISAQLALKLCMNSIYGKLAQRVGYNPETGRRPPFHQLEWAGWVTSHTRADLFALLKKIPNEHLISVETDGIYTTYPPEKLGIKAGPEIGAWSITEYEELMYVQSGLAWMKGEDGWLGKRRGLDSCKRGHTVTQCDCPEVFSLARCRNYLASLQPLPDRHTRWPVFEGCTTRFIGLGQALQSSPVLASHCVWETRPREISVGSTGKRIHVPQLCRGCKAGSSAYDVPHDLVVNTMAVLDPYSYPHDIPWEESEGHPRWRLYEGSLK